MNRRRFLRAALMAAAAPSTSRALALENIEQTPAGVTGIDCFPIYFAWYDGPGQWRLNADYFPALGRYLSDQRSVIAAQFGALSAHGGSGFAVNWHGRSGFVHETLINQFVPEVGSHPAMEFCLHYDPFIRWGLPMPRFASDAGAADQWRSDIRFVARSLMTHPQYAHVEGRPLLFIYLSRAIQNLTDLRAFVDIARQEVGAAGHSGVFLVLGEVWWIPADASPAEQDLIRSNWATRAQLGDAVYSFNLVTPPQNNAVWRGNVRTFLGEAQRAYKEYRNLMDHGGAGGVRVITTVMPRFDNTLVREFQGSGLPAEVISPWQGFDGIDYQADIEIGMRKLSPSFEPVRGDRTIVVAQTWNEWLERTAIEPTASGFDRNGLPLPENDYLVGLGRAVNEVLEPRDPQLRLEDSFERTRDLMESIRLRLGSARLGPELTEPVTIDQVSGGRRLYRAMLSRRR